jgi:hypothetical protein
MKSETFTGSTLAETKKAIAQWQATHKDANVKKEYSPVEVRTPAGRFAPKADGKVISVSIRIDYEDCSKP